MANKRPGHAKDSDLDRIPILLTALRAIPELVERRPGYFSHRGRAFLHFHADREDVFVDARLSSGEFERVRVTTVRAQRDVAARIRAEIRRVETATRSK